MAPRLHFAAALFLTLPCAAQNPPGVLYSTTLPGTGGPNMITVDASNNTYVVGSTDSNSLMATPGVLQPVYTGGTCMLSGIPMPTPCAEPFIAKFSSTGALVFLTYVGGGPGYEIPYAVAVDPSGNIYVGGTTTSTDFPLAGSPWRPAPSPANGFSFLAKISGDGTQLIWSTVISGGPVQLALTPSGNLDVLAEGPAGPTLTELTSAGQFVTSATVPMDSNSLAVGPDGSVYMAGSTYADGIPDVTPTPGAWQTTYGGGQNDGFVAKLNPDLSGFAWLTFVGGNGIDDLDLLTVAPDGTLWVSGATSSTNFPVLAGAFETSPEGSEGFLVHLSADGSIALGSTYTPFLLTALAADSSADVVFGGSFTATFPATPGAQVPCPPFVPANPPAVDNYSGFFGKMDPAGHHILWGTWVGPSVPNGVVAVDTHGNAITAGNLPGQLALTLSALSTSNTPHLVESCIAPSAPASISSPLAPGELFSIYGADYGPAQGVVAQPSGGMIGTELGGIQVLVEDTPVPLLYVSAAQINAVAPFLLNGRTAAHIKIVTASGTSNEVVLGVRDVLPEIFAVSYQGGTQNSQANPAHAGDFLSIWASGLGQTNPPGVDGAIPTAAGGTPLASIALQAATVQNPNISFGLQSPPVNVAVLYAGNAPGLVSGVTQINFEVPALPPPIPGSSTISGPPYAAIVTMTLGSAATSAYIWFE